MKYLVFLTLLAIFISCTDDIVNPIYSIPYEETETKTWNDVTSEIIEVINVNGSILVDATTQQSITADINRLCFGTSEDDAKAHINELVIKESYSGNKFIIEAVFPDNNRNYACDFDMAVLESKYLMLNTVNGDVSVDYMIVGSELVTKNGNLTLSNSKGNSILDNANGLINIQNHTRGVNATNLNGRIVCEITSLNPGDTVNLKTINGNVELTLPSDISAEFDARTAIGTVLISDKESIVFTTNHPTFKVGTIGSGEAVIILETNNGDVIINIKD